MKLNLKCSNCGDKVPPWRYLIGGTLLALSIGWITSLFLALFTFVAPYINSAGAYAENEKAISYIFAFLVMGALSAFIYKVLLAHPLD